MKRLNSFFSSFDLRNCKLHVSLKLETRHFVRYGFFWMEEKKNYTISKRLNNYFDNKMELCNRNCN